MNKTSDSDNLYEKIFDSINDGIIIHETKGQILDVNRSMYERLGYSKEEFLEMSLSDLVSPEFQKNIGPKTQDLIKKGVAIFESADRRKDGTHMPVEVSARHIDYGGKKVILSVVRDITERKMAEELISTTFSSRDHLLSEIRNRSRSLLHSLIQWIRDQTSSTELADTRSTLAALETRALATSFILDRLYQHSDFFRIDYREFFNGFISYLISSNRIRLDRITIRSEIDNVHLDIGKAIPLSFILFELITNSFKHAFPKDRTGEIDIDFKAEDNGRIFVAVRDNGVGPPDDLDLDNPTTPGLKILMENVRELEAELETTSDIGTSYTLRFQG